MKVQEIMTSNPACCTPRMPLAQVARLMLERDCGEIPVVDSERTRKPIGVVTDRDIACRAVAENRNPLELVAEDCMTAPAVTVTPETSVTDCCRTMEEHQVRRVPVVNAQGACCGIVSQADIARHAPKEQTAEVVQEVSRPTVSAL